MRKKISRDLEHHLTPREEDILNLLIGKELYGLEIIEGFERATTRCLSIGTLYPTLYKMEGKGFVVSRWGTEEDSERGGARRRYYRITGEGQRALQKQESKRGKLRAWQPAY